MRNGKPPHVGQRNLMHDDEITQANRLKHEHDEKKDGGAGNKAHSDLAEQVLAELKGKRPVAWHPAHYNRQSVDFDNQPNEERINPLILFGLG